MSSFDTGITMLRSASERMASANRVMGRRFNEIMPKGLYARALLIMIVPMVILQSVVAFVFMERHWNTVTRRLSAAVVQDIAALIDVYKIYPQDKDRALLRRIAQQRLGLASLDARDLGGEGRQDKAFVLPGPGMVGRPRDDEPRTRRQRIA